MQVAPRKSKMKKLLITTIAIGLMPIVGFSQIKDSPNIEMAARINVAENLCDINFGDRLLHFVMVGASELNISTESAAVLADSRHTEIVRFLNQSGRLDEFCQNARAGKL